MPSTKRRLAPILPLLLALPGLTGCGSGGSGGPTAGPSNVPSPSPSPSASATAFAIDVLPPEEPTAVRAVIPGQHSSFLVDVSGLVAGGDPVTIAATTTGGSIAEIVQPTAARPVGEVWFTPAATTTEAVGTMTITATRGTVVRTEHRTFQVMPMTDERGKDAKPYFDRWVAWLATAHPELGIKAGDAWQPEYVSTLLVVSHYAYFTKDWELTLLWHNMIPPYDWTEIHLRHRGTDAAPTLAFRQDSVKNASAPHPVAPPEVVVR